VVSTTGEKYIVKIASEDRSESFIEMEYLALHRVTNLLPDIKFPQLIENRFGNVETSLKLLNNFVKRLRLISFLSGDLLETTDISDCIGFNVGKSLARFDQAMVGFDHPAAHRAHQWDLAKALQHSNALELINNTENADDLKWAFNHYAKNIAGKLNQVKWQFIHGDANPENILVRADRLSVCWILVTVAITHESANWPFAYPT
jgi:Ser/Thr protein kinase RdoA (MazF antagonist)